jgi:hypothetical protein
MDAPPATRARKSTWTVNPARAEKVASPAHWRVPAGPDEPLAVTLFGDPDALERALRRAARVRLDAGECRCIDCRRTPLAGENVHVYEDGRVICELCRPHRREEPIRIERVHGLERGLAVRARRAA